MARMIQVRNVPDRLHRELIRRAARSGKSLTDYVEEILEREVARPTPDELFARIASRTSVNIGGSAADLIKRERRRAHRE